MTPDDRDRPPASKRNNGSDSGRSLIPQPHGGALLAGGVPGNKGGGRPKDRIKQALTEDLEVGLQQIGEALRNDELSVTEKQRLVDTGLKYVLPRPKQSYDEELVDELGAAIGAAMQGHPDRDEILDDIKERWVRILAAKRTA